jgi:hypothetical protein
MLASTSEYLAQSVSRPHIGVEIWPTTDLNQSPEVQCNMYAEEQ